ncbi:putative bifunctional diguanylate cyclase/phosphodiesterase [Lacisediminimonas profundi]|uniref:putative bifunctional diguanylate cyclase/phosphodiesterase n=1 Tax=Lacisediminimonas profundi TaxID=2603856 RepID=UPI001F4FB9C7|nr:EAL domain-containing protein [Lacisediminimonas profundi]
MLICVVGLETRIRVQEQESLAITVLRDREAISAGLHASHQTQYLRAGIASLLIILAAASIIHVFGRKQRLYVQLEHAQRQKQDLIEQLREERNRAFQLASHDYLTGIPNRMEFLALGHKELARARRSRKLCALFFLDLDKFKPVNDTLGHAVGDELLKAVAVRLRGLVREYDLLGRFGGDEFVLLVAELPSEDHMSALARKLIDAICTPFLDIEGHDIEISASIGIALAPRDGNDMATLLARADSAMYLAKGSGRGNFRFCDPALNETTARRYELVSRFRRAISENEFCLHYQARVRLSDFSIAGLEALVRWRHPEHGLIYPSEFIPLAETNDLIGLLGEWVIDAACRQLRLWQDAGLPVVPVAVNISARQLNDGSLSRRVMEALEAHDIAPCLLELEVTESCFMENAHSATEQLLNLQQIGIKISLDDYGTGFSSLNQLKRLPVGAIKIDRSFVQDIRNDTSDMMIVSSTIILAHNLGLRVVAEGVESSEQLVHLKTAGCDEVQGFYFHRPGAPESIPALLLRAPLIPVNACGFVAAAPSASFSS